MKMTKKTKKHLDILASFSKMLQLKLNSIFSKCKRFFSCYIYIILLQTYQRTAALTIMDLRFLIPILVWIYWQIIWICMSNTTFGRDGVKIYTELAKRLGRCLLGNMKEPKTVALSAQGGWHYSTWDTSNIWTGVRSPSAGKPITLGMFLKKKFPRDYMKKRRKTIVFNTNTNTNQFIQNKKTFINVVVVVVVVCV